MPKDTKPEQKARILIADDEKAITDGLSAILTDEGYLVEIAPDGQRALDRLSADHFGVVLADLKMPKLDGLALLKALQQKAIPTECIIITGQATVDSAVQAMRQGAYDYIEKPLNADKLNRLKALIPKALEKFNVQQKNRELTSRLEGLTHYGEMIGQSEAMRHVYEVIEAVASSAASVLILGESGTGKELVARALHSKSDRSKGPFFALNCAALPKDILENELFGHEKGAFTGSTNEKPGAFEMAHGGTIFLDEVAEMAPDIQVKLLRALESRQVRRLGGKKEISVDIRIIAATNRDLQQALAEKELREDLYYRLAVVELFLQPLRERIGDIMLLANEFLERYSTQNGKKFAGFDDSAQEWVLSYHWPGNVRELKNAVESAAVLATGDTIDLPDLEAVGWNGRDAYSGQLQRAAPVVASADAGSIESAPTATLAEVERLLIRDRLARSRTKEDAARSLGIGVRTLYTKLQALKAADRQKGPGSPRS